MKHALILALQPYLIVPSYLSAPRDIPILNHVNYIYLTKYVFGCWRLLQYRISVRNAYLTQISWILVRPHLIEQLINRFYFLLKAWEYRFRDLRKLSKRKIFLPDERDFARFEFKVVFNSLLVWQISVFMNISIPSHYGGPHLSIKLQWVKGDTKSKLSEGNYLRS